ncbi:MAG: PPOX class F420-dependent oxidoreductase [Thaumarchaeota archaeon]|nr:PPOX class F420-dependent oxidoreductase [Nitrososphaerota archaeon]
MTGKSIPVTFTEAELEYLSENGLGRLATSSPQNEPHVIPMGYEFDGTYIYFGTASNTLKTRNIQQNSKVAFVIDDVSSKHPWRARGIEIRGIAEIIENNHRASVKIKPLKKASWGLGGE